MLLFYKVTEAQRDHVSHRGAGFGLEFVFWFLPTPLPSFQGRWIGEESRKFPQRLFA